MTRERLRDAARILQKADEAGHFDDAGRVAALVVARGLLDPEFADVEVYACPYFPDAAKKLGRTYAFCVGGEWDDVLVPYDVAFDLRKG